MQLTAFQYLVSAASVSVLSLVSLVDAEGLRLAAVRKFWLVSAVFTLAIFSNTRVLHVASVETVIVFRSTVALLTSIGDWIWLGRELPEPRSWASLLVVVAGAAGYMISEGSGVTVDSVAWGTIYVMVLAFEVGFVSVSGPGLQLSLVVRLIPHALPDAVRETRRYGSRNVYLDARLLQQYDITGVEYARDLPVADAACRFHFFFATSRTWCHRATP